MRFLFVALSLLLSLNCGQLQARDLGQSLLPNVFAMPDIYVDSASKAPNNDMSGKQRVYPNLAAIKYIVTFGQSRTASNSVAPATPYVVTNRATCLVLNPYTDGAFFTADDPILGPSASPGFLFSGWHGRLCDELINNGWRSGNAIAFIPIAIAGSSMVEWQNGTIYGPRLLSAATMLTARGINPEFVLIQIGQSDCIAGTSQATMEAQLRASIAYWRSLPGRSADKFYITVDSIKDSANTTCPAIDNAQTAVGGDANNVVGANANSLTFPTYGDGLHLNNTGNAQMAVGHRARIMTVYP